MKFKRLFESFLFEAKEEDVEEVRRELESLGYTLRPQKTKSDGQIVVLSEPGEDRREVLNTIIKQLKNFDAELGTGGSSIGSAKLSRHVSVVVKSTGNGAGSRADSNTEMNELLQMFAGLLPDATDLNGIIDGLRKILDSSVAERFIKEIELRRDSLERKDGWLDSYIKTGRILREEIPNINSFVCFRTGGDYVTDSNQYKVRYNRIIQDLLTKTKLGGGKSDNLNPADIIFMKNPDRVLDIMQEKLDSFSVDNDVEIFYNDWKLMWYRLYEEGLFYPISLKKISGNGHVEYNNKLSQKEQEQIEQSALNLELESVTLNFNFKEITSNFTIRRTTTNEKGETELSNFVFQSRKQSDMYSNIACDTFIKGQKAQLGKIKTTVKRLCPELDQNVAKRFGDKKNKLSNVSQDMINQWQFRLESLLALENTGYRVDFKTLRNAESVQEMFDYAIQGTEDEKGMFALYMQTIDYFYGILCNSGDLNGRLADMINASLKINTNFSFFIKIS